YTACVAHAEPAKALGLLQTAINSPEERQAMLAFGPVLMDCMPAAQRYTMNIPDMRANLASQLYLATATAQSSAAVPGGHGRPSSRLTASKAGCPPVPPSRGLPRRLHDGGVSCGDPAVEPGPGKSRRGGCQRLGRHRRDAPLHSGTSARAIEAGRCN